MASQSVQAFMDGLQAMEVSRDPGALLRLFAKDCELENPARNVRTGGDQAARQFWQNYLSAFDEIRSNFTRITEGTNSATLEWRSTGRLSGGGTPMSYRGVSLLELNGDGQVARFCTYYDSASFLPDGSKHAGDRVTA